MNEELENKTGNEFLEQVSEFKTNHTREERRKRFKYFVNEYKKHMLKLKNIKPADENKPEEVELLNSFVKSHILHSNILKDYIKAFCPKNWIIDNITFDNLTIYYNVEEL